MNVLITGAQGQLGRTLQKLAPPHWAVTAWGSKQLDITDAQAVQEQVKALRPGLVINAAAYNAVDRAEQERERAFAVNAHGPRNLARAANQVGARLVHVSTDYVFDGHSQKPYNEQAVPNPLNAYGESKLQGEQWVLHEQPHAWVLRTAWVYSAEGQSFVAAMVKAAGQGRPLRVVNDQTGAPTFAGDLANAIIALAGLATAEPAGGTGAGRYPEGGIYHYSGATALTRYDFALAIFEAADRIRSAMRASTPPEPTQQTLQPSKPHSGGAESGHAAHGWRGNYGDLLSPIPSSEYPSAAARPTYSVLDCSKMAALGIPPKPLAASLPEVVRALLVRNGP